MPIHIPVSPGELIDRLTTLEVRVQRASEGPGADALRRDLDDMRAVAEHAIPTTPDVAMLRGQLKAINETLWDAEQSIAELERLKEFGARFVELSRAVFQNRARRNSIKQQLDQLLGDAGAASRSA